MERKAENLAKLWSFDGETYDRNGLEMLAYSLAILHFNAERCPDSMLYEIILGLQEMQDGEEWLGVIAHT